MQAPFWSVESQRVAIKLFCNPELLFFLGLLFYDGFMAGFEELRERHFGSILSVTRNGSVVAKNRREREITEIKITKLPRSQTRRRQNLGLVRASLYAFNL